MKNRKLVVSILSIALVALSANSNAVECNEESPNMKIEGDDYYQMPQSKPLSRNDKALIRKIFSPLRKTMKGMVVEVVCSQPEHLAKKIVEQKRVAADVSYFSGGEVTIQLEVEDVKKKTKSLQVLTFFNDNISHRVLGLTKGGVVVVSKVRKTNGRNGGSHLVEEIAYMAVNKWQFDIEIIRYLNGYFAESRHYKLNR